jgi:tRNA-splicing ligase RtcB
MRSSRFCLFGKEVSPWKSSRRQDVRLVLHSGSRGAGNRIGTFYIQRALEKLERAGVTIADRDLAHLTEHTPSFDAYVEAVGWA